MAEEEPRHNEETDPDKAYREMIMKIVVPILVEKGFTVYINEDNVIEISDENGYPLE